MVKKILILAESRLEDIRNVSFESIGAAKQINEQAEVVALLLGESSKNQAESLTQYGADRVITIQNDLLNQYTPEGYLQACLAILEEEEPDAFLMGHTSIGKDLAPRLAARLQTGLISDVVRIEQQDDKVVFIRPIYSGKAFEKRASREGLIFATIRSNNFSSLELDQTRVLQLEEKTVDIKDLRTIIKDVVRKATTGIDLSEAKVVVAGGRGLKSSEGFQQLQELAGVLGGAVGASRGACDAGYCDYSLQIGQTGKVVTPDLYIACGISGAIQHVAGMSNSKVIVAINKDPDANIFNIADFGIVGDLFEVVPLLTQEFRQLVRA